MNVCFLIASLLLFMKRQQVYWTSLFKPTLAYFWWALLTCFDSIDGIAKHINLYRTTYDVTEGLGMKMHGPPLSFPAAASALDQPSDLWSVLSVVSPSSPCPPCAVRLSPELESGGERAHHIQQIVVTLPRTVIIVMRYLFAFLNQWVQSHCEPHLWSSGASACTFFLFRNYSWRWKVMTCWSNTPVLSFGNIWFWCTIFFVGCPSDNDLRIIYLAWAPAAGFCSPTFSDVRVSFIWFGFKKQKCNLGGKACPMEVLSQQTPCLHWIRI